jgi:hypothetical protein
MLLSLMIVFAAGAILLFALEAFEELHDVWKYPEHRESKDHSRSSKLR